MSDGCGGSCSHHPITLQTQAARSCSSSRFSKDTSFPTGKTVAARNRQTFFFFNVAEIHHSFARYLLIELHYPNYSLQCPTTGPACERKSRVSEGHPNSDQKRNLNPCRHQRTLPSQQSPLLRTRALFHIYINDLFEECDSLVEFTLKTFFSRDCQRKSYAHAFKKREWKTSKKDPSSFRHRCPRPSFFRISKRFSDRLRE